MDRLAVCHRLRKRAEQVRAELFANQFPPCLKGMCAICTIALGEMFAARGWECRAYYGLFFHPGDRKGKTHFWLESGDLIYDLTATQFGDYPPVLVVPADDPRYGGRDRQVELNGIYWMYAPQCQRPSKEWIAVLTNGEITYVGSCTRG